MESVIQAVYHSGETLSKQPHFHTCHQIILIVSGNVDFLVNGKTLHGGAGDLAIFSCYEDHSVFVRSESYERFVLQLDPSADDRDCPAYSLLTDRPAGFSNIIHVSSRLEQIKGLFCALIRERSEPAALGPWMERLLVSQLLVTVFRCTGLEIRQLQDSVVSDLKRQLECHFGERYTLDALAAKYSISVSSLAHRFQATTGTSVMDYLLSCRMAQAKQLLANTDHSIGQIVERCGFSDNSNFSRTFKKLNGLSPTAFRKKYKNG